MHPVGLAALMWGGGVVLDWAVNYLEIRFIHSERNGKAWDMYMLHAHMSFIMWSDGKRIV